MSTLSSQFPSSSSSSSSSTVSTIALTDPKDIANELFEALKRETEFRTKMHLNKKDMENALKPVDKAPPRDKVNFYTDNEKANKGPSLSDEDEEQIFCAGHGRFVLDSGTSIEHGTPYKAVCENIDRFLSYLNSNSKIADEFLKKEDKKEAIWVSNFFVRDPDPNGPVKATLLLYKVTFNQPSNLWLVCQPCNNEKGKKEGQATLNWFRDNAIGFGKDFVNTVNGLGGFKTGIIFESVPNSSQKTVCIGKDLNGRDYNISIGGSGIGLYVHNWFLENRDVMYKGNKLFESMAVKAMQNHINKIVQLLENGEKAKAEREERQFKRDVNLAGSSMGNKQEEFHSESESDSEEATKTVNKDNKDTNVNKNSIRHHIDLLKQKVAKFAKDNGEFKEISKYFDTQVLEKALKCSKEDIDQARKSIEKEIDDGRISNFSDVKNRIEELLKTPEEKTEKAEQRADSANQRAVMEAQEKERERQEKEQERQEKEELKRQNKKLIAKITEMEKRQQTAAAPSSSSSSSSDKTSAPALSEQLRSLESVYAGFQMNTVSDQQHETQITPMAEEQARQRALTDGTDHSILWM